MRKQGHALAGERTAECRIGEQAVESEKDHGERVDGLETSKSISLPDVGQSEGVSLAGRW
jgi:hypothetical protein